MNLPHIITDGYTRSGYIKADPGFHDELRFQYRPMLPVVRHEYLFRSTKASGERDAVALTNVYIDVILHQCVDLAASGDSGKTVQIVTGGSQVANARDLVKRLEPTLLQKLYEICLGITPSDREPDRETEDRSENGPVDQSELMRRLDANEESPKSHAAEEVLLEGQNAGN